MKYESQIKIWVTFEISHYDSNRLQYKPFNIMFIIFDINLGEVWFWKRSLSKDKNEIEVEVYLIDETIDLLWCFFVEEGEKCNCHSIPSCIINTIHKRQTEISFLSHLKSRIRLECHGHVMVHFVHNLTTLLSRTNHSCRLRCDNLKNYSRRSICEISDINIPEV